MLAINTYRSQQKKTNIFFIIYDVPTHTYVPLLLPQRLLTSDYVCMYPYALQIHIYICMYTYRVFTFIRTYGMHLSRLLLARADHRCSCYYYNYFTQSQFHRYTPNIVIVRFFTSVDLDFIFCKVIALVFSFLFLFLMPLLTAGTSNIEP